MSVPVLTFFNNKGGVGKTSLVYHLAWKMASLGRSIIAIDLDPQANLTSAFLTEEVLEPLWAQSEETIFGWVQPLTEVGDLKRPRTLQCAAGLQLLPGDLRLAEFEEFLSKEWPESLGSGSLYRPFRLLTAFWQVAQMAAADHSADLILADVGPNLGAINRSTLIASDFLVIPLAADLFSLQGVGNLGPTLHRWKSDWEKRLDNWSEPAFAVPQGKMKPLGYVVQQHSERSSRPVKAYQRWAERIPQVYREKILRQEGPPVSPDPCCLAAIKHYRSLVPLAQEARKPIFALTPADGAIGSHAAAARDADASFEKLATDLLRLMELE